MRKSLLFLAMMVCAALAWAQTQETCVVCTVTPDSLSIVEGNSGTTTLKFTLVLKMPDGSSQTSAWKEVEWSTTDGSATIADDDYESDAINPVWGKIRWEGTDPLTKTMSIAINGDDKWENDENLYIEFRTGAVADPVNHWRIRFDNNCIDHVGFWITIVNDDSTVGVQVADYTFDPEGTGPAGTFKNDADVFEFTQLPAEGYSYYLEYSHKDGSATFPADYNVATEPIKLTVTPADDNPYKHIITPPYGALGIWCDWLAEPEEHYYTTIDSFSVLDEAGKVVDWLTLNIGEDATITIIDDDSIDVAVTKGTYGDDGEVEYVWVGQRYTHEIVVSAPELTWPVESAVTVNDQLPGGMIFVGSDTEPYSYDPELHLLTWEIPGLTAGTSWVAVDTVDIDPDLPEGTVLTNVAKIAAINDSTLDNNEAESSVIVLRPSVDECVNINSDINVGLPPLIAHFESLKPLSSYKWYLDLNKHSNWPVPNYIYQYVIPPTGATNTYDITLRGPVETVDAIDFIRVYNPGGLGKLVLVDHTNTTSAGIWENAVDGDIYWYDGTTEAAADASGAAWAIFEFADQSTRKVNTIRLMTDTGINNLKKQVTHYEVLVSTDGISYTKVVSDSKSPVDTPCDWHDSWQSYNITPVDARYIKLLLKRPLAYTYAALGEFEVWYDAKLASASQSSITVAGNSVTLVVKDAGGNPITGLTGMDIVVYSYNTNDYHGDAHAVIGSLLGEDTVNPGTYNATVVNRGYVKASVNGVLIGSGALYDVGQADQTLETAANTDIPTSYAIYANYPNPFNPQTSITYDLPEENDVVLKVFDLTGKEVATLVDAHQPAGTHTAIWQASQMPSGVYFFRITAGSFAQTRRMVLLK